jgi:cephalosporin-C deacetylase-like acetyl esterase
MQSNSTPRLRSPHRCFRGETALRGGFLVLVLSVFLGTSEFGEPAQRPAESLAESLKRLETVVVPAGEQKGMERMLADAIQRRRQELNERNTAEWQAVKNTDDWEKFRKEKLARLEASLGQFPAPPRPIEVHRSGTVSGEGFGIDNLVFQSRPGLWVTANLYRPEKPGSSMPGILICHAHHTPKEHGELQDMGMTWARAGCLVLVMDQLGHGERRQHPFVDATSYPKPYQVSRQDYYFRYDSGIQLHLAGDSLIGWMAWDLRRGVDLLLQQDGIDPQRIILLGSVAGGGDPAAVVAALDERIAAVAPFNFGGPSPRPQYPFPPDMEPVWNYAGGGSWESTRNLRNSAADGFLPWVLVAAAAPRRLVYAHEFGWYREGDPVWKRLQAVYGFHDAADRLAFTFGKGDVSKRPPEGTHCTHIGALHRRMMHEAFRRWFRIEVTPEQEYSNRLPPDKLRCLTAEIERRIRPRKLIDVLNEVADERMAKARRLLDGKPAAEQRQVLRREWSRILGSTRPLEKPQVRQLGTERLGNAEAQRFLLTVEPGITVPLVLLVPKRTEGQRLPAVVAVCQSGKTALLRERAAEIATLLESGVTVCLPDVRGTGESGLGSGRGRSSAATSLSSAQLMLGETLVSGQLRDLRAVMAWLRSHGAVDAARLALWGDSLAAANPADTNLVIPRESDALLPPSSEPLGGLLVLLAALHEDDVLAILVRGGLSGYRAVLDHHLALIPHDAVLPGVLAAGDLSDVAGALAPRPLRLEGLVDGVNRRLKNEPLRQSCQRTLDAYHARGVPQAVSLHTETFSDGQWLLAQLKKQ